MTPDEEADEREKRMREAGHEIGSEEERQAILNETLMMLEWERADEQ